MQKLYRVIEESLYCEEGALGYIEEKYEDDVVKFVKIDSDIEVYVSKYSLEVVE